MPQKQTFKEKLDEKIVTGGGATGVSIGDPASSGVTRAKGPGNSKVQGDLEPKKLEGEVQETDPANNTKPTADNAASNKASVAMKEEIEAMFVDADLTEEFKERAVVVFESAVAAKVKTIEEQLAAQYEEAFASIQEENQQELAAHVDQYLNYVVEQWMEENQVAIESSIKTEISEEFIAGLKQLFEENNIDIPEEKIDVVEELANRVAELEEQLNGQISENIELRKVSDVVEQQSIFDEVSEGLAATEAEKFATIVEGVEFTSAESYQKKLGILKENYFPSKKSSAQDLTEQIEEVEEPKVVTKGPMANYAAAISRTVKNR